ncbi:MAG TPA: DUF5134 domain-containing protein [Streptosporangiaceae bacterium]
MAGPSWLAGTFAAVMIVVAAYSASRLAVSRLRGRVTESDVDGVHAVMGVAMAGMLVPRLNVLPTGVWTAVFGAWAVWFGWRALLPPGLRAAGGSRCRFPVPHLIECAAMLVMLLPMGANRPAGAAGTTMAGMAAPAGLAGRLPVVAVVLALFMIGYIVWTTDRLTSLVRAGRGPADPARSRDLRPPLAPGLAACGKIAMGITMGYMLLLMV